MKKFLLLYNIIFLLAGNVFLSNLHFLHDHHHEASSDTAYHECEECINFQNNVNYFSSFNNLLSIKNQFISFRCKYLNNIKSVDNFIYSSRAPPIPFYI